jgi:hypothetical protein
MWQTSGDKGVVASHSDDVPAAQGAVNVAHPRFPDRGWVTFSLSLRSQIPKCTGAAAITWFRPVAPELRQGPLAARVITLLPVRA